MNEELEFEETFEELEEELEEEIEETNEEELIEEDSYSLLRDVLDQNVETQHLPSIDKFDLLDEDNPRNTTYQVKDDANIRLYDKFIKETIELTGEEYNDYLLNEYGTNQVEYHSGEPDFSDYVQQINSEDISNFLEEEIENSFNGIGKLENSSISTERLGENGTLHEAYQQIADELGCTSEQVQDYIEYNNLVIHEKNKDEFELIPSDVHNVFRHTGSIGIKKDLEALRDSIYEKCDSDSLVLERRDDSYQANGVNGAILETIKHNREIKRN